jgi:hypothetical protein
MRCDPNIVGPIRHFGRRRGFDVSPSLSRRAIGGSAGSIPIRGVVVALVMTELMGCAIHPIPDDVSPIPTENIVSAARCEMRLGLVDKVRIWFSELGIVEDNNVFNPDFVADNLKKINRRYPQFDLDDWNTYMAISVAYEWTFD